MEQNEKGLMAVTCSSLLVLVMEIYTYAVHTRFFWIFFILERGISYIYEDDINDFLEVDDINSTTKLQKASIIVLTVGTIALSIYAFFKYVMLFGILMCGELIDFIIRRIRKG